MNININKLLELLEAILGDKGCPWGKAQKVEALCHYIIEESYEVIDATIEKNSTQIEEELGDVLFATLFAIQAACIEYQIDPNHLIDQICQKIERRHPHVFENPRPISLAELRIQWEEIKAKERAEKNEDAKENLFSCVAKSMPLVTRAMKHIELGESQGFKYKPDESTLEGQFFKLIIEGLNQYENLEKVFEKGIVNYQMKFDEWLRKEKPEMIS